MVRFAIGLIAVWSLMAVHVAAQTFNPPPDRHWRYDAAIDDGVCFAEPIAGDRFLFAANMNAFFVVTGAAYPDDTYMTIVIDGRSVGSALFYSVDGIMMASLTGDQVTAMRRGANFRVRGPTGDQSQVLSLLGSDRAIGNLSQCAVQLAEYLDQRQRLYLQAQAEEAARVASAERDRLVAEIEVRERLRQEERARQQQSTALMNFGAALLSYGSVGSRGSTVPSGTRVFTTPYGVIVCSTTGQVTNCH